MKHHGLGTEKGSSAIDEPGDPAHLTSALLNTAEAAQSEMAHQGITDDFSSLPLP